MRWASGTLAAAVLLAGGRPLLATVYTWSNAVWSEDATSGWDVAGNWSPAGAPATAADTGAIGSEFKANATAELGAAGDRPTIDVEAGGTLYLLDATLAETPLVLNGGTIDTNYRYDNLLTTSVTVLADSTIITFLDSPNSDGPHFPQSPQLHGAANVTLTLSGQQGWTNATNNTTYAGNIHVADAGSVAYVHTSARRTDEAFGTGAITLDAGTFLAADVWYNSGHDLTLTNDISGSGNIQRGAAYGGYDGTTITLAGKALTPGTAGTSAQLAVNGALNFTPDADGALATLNLDVTGAGATPGSDFDQLVIAGAMSNLGNADLVVHISSSNVNTLVILTTAGDLSAGDPGNRFHQVVISGGTADVIYGNGYVALRNVIADAVPEPAALPLLALGVLLLVRRRRAGVGSQVAARRAL